MRDKHGRWHPTIGFCAIRDERGKVTWKSPSILNTLAYQGQQDMLNVYFKETSHKTKYLALLNQPSAVDPLDSATIADVVETNTPGTNGYSRLSVSTSNWASPSLVLSDYRINTSSEFIFGPFTTTPVSISHVALVTTSSGVTSPATLFLVYWAIGTTLTIPIGKTFTFTPGLSIA